jgi:shikimate dehydrogenase
LKFAVIGDPLSHTLSPMIHNTNFAALNLKASYEALNIKPEALQNIRQTAEKHQLSGFNVTIPHKEKVIAFLDDIDEHVKKIGAVNTVHIDDGRYIGYNTDVSGYKSAYLNQFNDVRRKVLILGAGGVSKAVHRAHADLGDEVFIYARRAASFENFITEDYTPLLELEHLNYDVIINATPVGLKDEDLFTALNLKQNMLTEETIGIDLIYQPEQTKFLTYFNQNKIMNGLPMLVFQAMHAFKIWTGQEGDYKAVDAALKSHFGG